MIPAPEALISMIVALNELGRPYIVTGSVASNAYGQPRGTIDADFVVDLEGEEIVRLRRMLESDFDAEPQMAFETVTGKAQHKFRHRKSKFLIEIFEAKMDDPHERSRFERRREENLFGHKTFFPTAEDVIIGKLRWYGRIRRAKDREDIRHVLRRQWNSLDWHYIERWCAKHNTLEVLNEIRAELAQNVQDTEQR